MTAVELAEKLADDSATDQQRADARRTYGFEAAADAGIDAYGTRILPMTGGAS